MYLLLTVTVEKEFTQFMNDDFVDDSVDFTVSKLQTNAKTPNKCILSTL